MDHTLEKLPQYLAQNVLALRQKRGFSQGQLAKIAGIPRSTVTYIESGEGNPSLQNLAKIAASLQITIEELLHRPRAQVQMTLAKNVKVIKKGQGLAEVFKLLPDPIPGTEVDRMEIVVGGRISGVPHVTQTKEYLIGIQGEVQVSIATEKFIVRTGDVLAFPGDQPHSYQNIGQSKAICISVVMMAPTGI
jgi:XRE family transcriptional regulator, regulator of sulfur utilization